MGTTIASMTLEEFERLDCGADQIELLKGELIRMPPAQYGHMEIVERLYNLLWPELDRLRKSNPNTTVGRAHIERGYRMKGTPHSWLQPDVSIAHAGQEHDRYYIGAPLIAFEVVSEYNRADQLDEKVAEYLDNGAAEVWVIYPIARHALVYRENSARMEAEAVRTDLLPGIEIPFTQIFEA
jgi:Uma2 family endonuclease